jgi:hypothetical protein
MHDMAKNNYSYCEKLELKSKDEFEWIKAICYIANSTFSDSYEEPDWDDDGNPKTPEAKEFKKLWPEGFEQGFDYTLKEGVIYFNGDEGGLDTVCAIVQEFLKKFYKGKGTKWSITYASHCSCHRVGEFGGGAVIVTENGMTFHNVYDWVQDQLE